MRTIVLFLSGLVLYPYIHAQDINLVNNGKSSYVVKLRAQATNSEKRAADIFRYYFQMSTGVNLPVTQKEGTQPCIFIEYNIRLKNDAIHYYIKAGNIYILGGGTDGVINSVYRFMSVSLNFRWLANEVAVIPKQRHVVIRASLNEVSEPDFSLRTIHSLEGYDPEFVIANQLQIPFADHYDYAHTFQNDMLPEDSFFTSHPDYYAQKNGKRIVEQPNLVNPAVLNVVVKNIKKKIHLSPKGKYKYYSVSLNDNPVIDESSISRSILQRENGNYMSILLNFVNQVADSFPEKNITTLAYMQTKRVPRTVRPRSNVTILLTNADTDKSKSMFQDGYDVQQRLDMKQLIPDWVATKADIILWDYISNFANPFMPWPIIYTIKPNLLFYKQSGIKKLFMQTAGRFKSGFSELTSFVTASLMWNTNCNTDSLITVFCRNYYGNSWQIIDTYVKEINLLSFSGKDKMYTYDSAGKYRNTLFSFRNVTRWRGLLLSAENSSENGTYKTRIMKERISLDYVYIMISAAYRSWNLIDSKSRLIKLTEQFVTDAQYAKVNRLSETGYTPKDFALSIKKYLQ